MDLLAGIFVVTIVVVVWRWLGRFTLGRATQVLLTAAIYVAWLSIILLSIYFVGNSVVGEIREGSFGKATFLALASLTFIPIFILALIPWNFFCHYVRRKVGLRLPLSRRLAGDDQYRDWKREARSDEIK